MDPEATNVKAPFDPTDDVERKILLDVVIKTRCCGSDLVRRNGLLGICGALLIGLSDALKPMLINPAIWKLLLMVGSVITMEIVYFKTPGIVMRSFESGAMVLAAIVLIAWAWGAAKLIEDSIIWRQITGDVLKSKNNSDKYISTSSSTYRWFVDKFSIGQYSAANHPVKSITELLGIKCETIETFKIKNDYKDGGNDATDYLCVIYAEKKSSFLKNADKFNKTLKYFAEFDRWNRPVHRITRIFSVPTIVSDQVVDWKFSLNKDQRKWLLCYLWINWATGVDTKLHCFSSSFSSSQNDFFQAADYVWKQCLVDGKEGKDNGKLVFIAIPGNEEQCYKVSGDDLIHRLFQFEFYQRLSGAHSERKHDVIVDVNRRNFIAIKKHLSLNELDVCNAFSQIVNWANGLEISKKEYFTQRIGEWEKSDAQFICPHLK